MATYAAYRHIELDKVGYSKKRVRNTPSEIFTVMSTPPNANQSNGSSSTPRRQSQHHDSFTSLFGSPENKQITPRRGSLTKQDVKNRNPVTGNGVRSWDSKPVHHKVRKERNPVTGEYYTIVSPAVTPTKPMENGFAHTNGTSTPLSHNSNPEPISNGHVSNGDA